MKKIYIIHGWTYTLKGWDAFLADLRSRGFEPVMLQVPGLTEPSDKVWTLDEYVVWLGQKLAEEEEIVLLGHSNGGRIAIAFAAKNPGSISRLILLDSAGIVHNEPELRFRRAVFGKIAKIGKSVTSSPRARKLFYRFIGARDYERAPENMRATMANLIKVDLTEELSKISIPSLIIWGKEDHATPVSDAKIMHEKIKGSTLFIITNAHHSPQITHSKIVAEQVSKFLLPFL